MKITGSSLFSFFIALLMVIFITESFDYSAKARLIPIIVGSGVLIMVTFLFIADAFPSLGNRLSFVHQKGIVASQNIHFDNGKQDTNESHEIEPANKFEILKIFIWLAGFIVLLHISTYLVAVPAFLFLFIWLVGKERIASALGIAVAMGISIYVLFELILGARL